MSGLTPFNLALVTGATSGIGRAFCKILEKHSIPFIAVGRNGRQLEALQSAMAVPVTILQADLSTSEGLAKVLEIVRERIPDLVVNNAGLGLYGTACERTLEEQLALVRLNSEAPLAITIEAGKALQSAKRKGCILNVSSAVAFFTSPYFATYAASKSFVNHFSKSFALEWEGSGVDLLVACPGQVDTQFQQRASGGSPMGYAASYAMTPEFAAAELWQQIESRQLLHTFDWRYRLARLLTYLVPQRFLAAYLARRIKERLR